MKRQSLLLLILPCVLFVVAAKGARGQGGTATVHNPVVWSFEVLQDGVRRRPKAGVVTLRRAPFTLRFTLPEGVEAVRLNALDDDRVFRAMHPGFDFDSCGKTIVALCNGTALAEDDGNIGKRLRLTAHSMHYITADRVDRTSKTPNGIVFDRDVAALSDQPVSKTRFHDLYLVAIVRTGDFTLLREDELKTLHLRFKE